MIWGDDDLWWDRSRIEGSRTSPYSLLRRTDQTVLVGRPPWFHDRRKRPVSLPTNPETRGVGCGDPTPHSRDNKRRNPTPPHPKKTTINRSHPTHNSFSKSEWTDGKGVNKQISFVRKRVSRKTDTDNRQDQTSESIVGQILYTLHCPSCVYHLRDPKELRAPDVRQTEEKGGNLTRTRTNNTDVTKATFPLVPPYPQEIEPSWST